MGWVSTAESVEDKESKISWGRAQELDSGHIPTSGWEIKLLKRDGQKGGLRPYNVAARLREVGNRRSWKLPVSTLFCHGLQGMTNRFYFRLFHPFFNSIFKNNI